MMVMQRPLRILLANHPKLMREAVLGVFAGQPDIEIIGEVSEDAEIRERVNQTLPDLLIVSLEEPEKRPAICDAVLKAHPEIRIIAISPTENHTVCYWASTQIKCKNIETSEKNMLVVARSILAGKSEFLWW